MAFIDQFEHRNGKLYYRNSGKGVEYQVTRQQVEHWQERAHEATMLSLITFTLGLFILLNFMGAFELGAARAIGIPMIAGSYWFIHRAWGLPLRELAITAPVSQELRTEEVRDRFWKARPVHFWLALPLTIGGVTLLRSAPHARAETLTYVFLPVVLALVGLALFMLWRRWLWKHDRRSNLDE